MLHHILVHQLAQPLEHRQLVAQALAAAGTADEHDVLAREHVTDGPRLKGMQVVDADARERGDHVGVQLVWHGHRVAVARRLAAVVHDLIGVADELQCGADPGEVAH